VNLVIASHPLQRFWMNTEQLCRFIAVQERLESKFICWHGLAGRGGEPRWLGCGHDWLLSQIQNAETDFDLADMRTVMRSTIRAALFTTLSLGLATCLIMIGGKVIPAGYKGIRAAIFFPS
jgi:hypothetical protein